MEQLILVRHTSVDVPPGTCYGQSDVPLKESFLDEALSVRQNLNSYTHFDMVYTSPLSRCRRLASFCGFADAVCDRRIMELNFGEWEMQQWDKICDPHLQVWFDNYLKEPATGGESFEMQYERVVSFIEELRQRPERRILAFTHGGVITCAQIYAGRVSVEDAFNAVVPYGGVLELQFSETNPAKPQAL